MSFTEKTNYLLETKSLLKDRINSLGGSITSGTTFRDYLLWLDSLYEALDEKTITGLPDSLEGKCEQTGTPTPSSPIPINITTGRQVVSVKGKNLIDLNNLVKGQSTVSFTWENDILTVESSSGTYRDAHIDITDLIKNNAGKKIRLDYDSIDFSQSNAPTVNLQLINNGSTTYPTMIAPSGNVSTYTIPSDTSGITQVNLRFMCNNSSTSQAGKIVITKPILHFGDSDTTYEEYKGNDYEINLGKNLCETMSSSTSQGVTLTPNSDGSYTLNGTTTGVAIFNKTLTTQLPPGTYTVSYESSVPLASDFFVRIRKANGTMLVPNGIPSQVVGNNTTTNKTTFTSTDYGAIVAINLVTTGITYNNVNVKIQLEKGTGTSYSPYKTPIYLGKIGTYQDYIFKNTTENPLYDSNLEEGQWYIHKEIGRVVLNGSESWGKSSSTRIDRFFFNFTLPSTSASQSTNTLKCTHFKIINNSGTYEVGTMFIGSANSSSAIFVDYTSYGTTSLANFKTWLSSNNVEVYYVLNIPTNTLIEDEELINQLNEIDIFTVISEDFYN